MELDARGGTLVRRKLAEESTGGEIPQLHAAVLSAGEHPLPIGENLHTLTPRSWPLYVWMHPLRRMSQIFRLVSSDPLAKNSPKGWNRRRSSCCDGR